MFRKYSILLAFCAAFLLAGCGSDKPTTDTKTSDSQQEMQKDAAANSMQKDQTENKDTGVEKAIPEENVEKGTPQEELKQDKTEQEGEDSMKRDMDKTMPEKNIYQEKQTLKDNYPVTGVLRT